MSALIVVSCSAVSAVNFCAVSGSSLSVSMTSGIARRTCVSRRASARRLRTAFGWVTSRRQAARISAPNRRGPMPSAICSSRCLVSGSKRSAMGSPTGIRPGFDSVIPCSSSGPPVRMVVPRRRGGCRGTGVLGTNGGCSPERIRVYGSPPSGDRAAAIRASQSELGRVNQRSACGCGPEQGGIRTVSPHKRQKNVRCPEFLAAAAGHPQTSQPTRHRPPISR